MAPLLALIVALGFYPKPLLDVINPAVDATLQPASTCTIRSRPTRRRANRRGPCRDAS